MTRGLIRNITRSLARSTSSPLLWLLLVFFIISVGVYQYSYVISLREAGEIEDPQIDEPMNVISNQTVSKCWGQFLRSVNKTSKEKIELILPIDNPNACKRLRKLDENDLTLLILIPTLAASTQRRRLIRRGWRKNSGLKDPKSTQVIFIVGTTAEKSSNRFLENEAYNYGDVIQVAVPDSIDNLARKILTGLKWAESTCPQAELVAKVDDDTFFNHDKIKEVVAKSRVKTASFVAGRCAVSEKPERRREYRWQVSPREYPCEIFPSYIKGPAYIMSRQAMIQILRLVQTIPMFKMEDVFVTGFLASIKLQLPLICLRKMFGLPHDFDECFVKNDLLSVHKISMVQMEHLWDVVNSERKCNPWRWGLKQPKRKGKFMTVEGLLLN